MALIKRQDKGQALTYNELDGNFTHLGGDGSYQFPATAGRPDQVLVTDSNGNLIFADYAVSSVKGSIYGDDSTLLVDGVASEIVGNINNSLTNTETLTAETLTAETLTVSGLTTLTGTTEVWNNITGATGTVTHDLTNGAIFDHYGIATDFTADFTNVPSTPNRTTSVVLILHQGSTAYMPTSVKIDGTTLGINWQGGSAPTGTSDGVDVVSFTLIKPNIGNWSVLGSATDYSYTGLPWTSIATTTVLDNPNAYDTSADDQFGRNVAISGNYAIIGARLEDDAGGTSSGKAYIFNVTDGSLVHTLDNPNAYGTSETDLFGSSVAISGDRAIVGAVVEDDAGGDSSGKAYIFDVTTGNLLHTLDNPNAYGTSAYDQFGYRVAIDGDRAIVSAYVEDEEGYSQVGKAYIFNVTTGALVHTLDNPNDYGNPNNDDFNQVAISGNYAIVGAPGEDTAELFNTGRAYIFDVTTGSLLHTLESPDTVSTYGNNDFGNAVAISGNRAIVGAPQEAKTDPLVDTYSGRAYIFDVTTGSLVHTLDNPNAYDTPGFDYFGTSVAISGDYAIVGAESEDDAGGTASGKAYIFDVTTGDLLYTLDNPNAYDTSASDRFGISVAINDNYAIVGAHLEDDAGGTSSGKAYIFKRS